MQFIYHEFFFDLWHLAETVTLAVLRLFCSFQLKQVIETRIGNLEKKLEGEDKEKNQKQLDDLRTLLPDIIAKVSNDGMKGYQNCSHPFSNPIEAQLFFKAGMNRLIACCVGD